MSKARNLGGILRNRRDWRSLVFVFLALTFLALPHVRPIDRWLAPAWIAAASFLCFVASIINHNHMHNRVFAQRWLNGILNIALTLARGHTASGIIVPHNMNHHVETNKETDWIRPQLAGDGLGWVRMVRYVVRASVNMGVQRMRDSAPRLERGERPEVLAEKVIIATAIVVACWYDYRVFLFFNVLPWMLGLAMLVGVNLLQHEGCDSQSPLGGSRNFIGPVGNWLLFNNGFHTAHHIDPGMHWSELPTLHVSIRSRLSRDDLEVHSILGYLWKFSWHRTTAEPEARQVYE